jgi:hypothetical protein
MVGLDHHHGLVPDCLRRGSSRTAIDGHASRLDHGLGAGTALDQPSRDQGDIESGHAPLAARNRKVACDVDTRTNTEVDPMRVVSVLFALAILGIALWLIPQTRRGMLVAAESVSITMPRMR